MAVGPVQNGAVAAAARLKSQSGCTSVLEVAAAPDEGDDNAAEGTAGRTGGAANTKSRSSNSRPRFRSSNSRPGLSSDENLVTPTTEVATGDFGGSKDRSTRAQEQRASRSDGGDHFLLRRGEIGWSDCSNEELDNGKRGHEDSRARAKSEATPPQSRSAASDGNSLSPSRVIIRREAG